ncbi:MAG: hypothetical protein GY711_14675 [bacterium]|nr:hypothetical protein [bacterium]
MNGKGFDFGFLDIRATGADQARTDNEIPIQVAIDAQAARGGGRVCVPNGTWRISGSIYLRTGVWLEGSSRLGSILRVAPGATGGIKTLDFEALFAACEAGNCSGDGQFSFGLRDLQIDGNKGNGATGDGVSIYGTSFGIESVFIRDFAGWGLISMYAGGNSHGPLGAPEGPPLEAHVRELVVKDCAAGQIDWAGPHDSLLANVITVSQSIAAIPAAVRIRDNGSAVQFLHSHFWGGDPDHQLFVETGSVQLTDCQVEGGRLSQIYLCDAAGCKIIGGRIAGQSPNTQGQKGIVFDNARNTYIYTSFSNLNGGAIDFSGDSGNNLINCIVGLRENDVFYVGQPARRTVRHMVARRALDSGEADNLGEVMLNSPDMPLGFFGEQPLTQRIVTGKRASNPALANLLRALSDYGLIDDQTVG